VTIATRPTTHPFRSASTPGQALAIDQRLALAGREAAFVFDVSSPICFDASEVDDGIAVLAIGGPLEHHPSWCWNSYTEIVEQIAAALADASVTGVILRIDSPGGDVAGMGEAHKAILRLRAEHGKPIFAYADELIASAAYEIACACDEIWMPESAIVGSVGVISTVVDDSKMHEKVGVAIRYVTSGARKADGHDGNPVSDEMLANVQTRVDALATMFFRDVARARGMTPDAVKALQAGVFLGQAAVDAGLADGVNGWDDFLLNVRAACATFAPIRATAPAPSALHTGKGPPTMKILKLTKAAADAKAAVATAKKALGKAATPADRTKALALVETSLRAKIAADDALAAARPKAKTVTETTKTETDAEEDDAEEDESESAAEEDDAEDGDEEEDEEEEPSTAGSEAEPEEEDAEDKAISASYKAAAGGTIYSPARLLRLAQQVTGQKGVKAVFGALDGMGQRLAAVGKTEARLAKLEGESTKSKVDSMVEKALAAGKITKAQVPDLKSKGMKDRQFLRGFLATLPKQYRTVAADGEGFVPRAGTDGNPIDAPSADAQKMDQMATAGMNAEQAAKHRASVADKLKTKTGASRNPSH
jgi:signal peptide peptidase SppA